jgi:putative hydroxymethylpyrimidine transport system substrate-binding protein
MSNSRSPRAERSTTIGISGIAQGIVAQRRSACGPISRRRGSREHPEVVLMTARKTLAQRRDTLRRALQAIEEGLRDTLARPDAAARQIAAAAETRDVGLTRAQLDAVSRAFAPGLRLDRHMLEQWADFDARIGIVERRPDVRRAFDFSLAGR